MGQYEFLVNGEAENSLNQFFEEEHTFDEYTEVHFLECNVETPLICLIKERLKIFFLCIKRFPMKLKL